MGYPLPHGVCSWQAVYPPRAQACPCVTAVALQLPIVWSNSPWLLTAQLFLALGFPWWILGSPFLFHPKMLDFQVHWIDRVGENGHLWWWCYPTYEYGVTSFLLHEQLTFLLLDLIVGISCHWGCFSVCRPLFVRWSWMIRPANKKFHSFLLNFVYISFFLSCCIA